MGDGKHPRRVPDPPARSAGAPTDARVATLSQRVILAEAGIQRRGLEHRFQCPPAAPAFAQRLWMPASAGMTRGELPLLRTSRS